MKKALIFSALILAAPLSVSFAGGMGNTQAVNLLNRASVSQTPLTQARVYAPSYRQVSNSDQFVTTEGRTFRSYDRSYVPTVNRRFTGNTRTSGSNRAARLMRAGF